LRLLRSVERQLIVDLMGHSQGRTNVRKRAARRKKHERLALAKKNSSKKSATAK
jgi:hypothetical protein